MLEKWRRKGPKRGVQRFKLIPANKELLYTSMKNPQLQVIDNRTKAKAFKIYKTNEANVENLW